ncbi:MAG: Hsp20/alpha crystallin family protein [Burkholderiales bacterium]|jgi:HSP20 family protein
MTPPLPENGLQVQSSPSDLRRVRDPQGLSGRFGALGPWLRPPVDIIEDETGIVVIADIPGVPLERMALRTEADQLIIEGELATHPGSAGSSELPPGRYRRSFALSRELDPQGISAAMDQGVLRIHIPRESGSHVRRIPIMGA